MDGPEIRLIPVYLEDEILPGDGLLQKLNAALRHQKIALAGRADAVDDGRVVRVGGHQATRIGLRRDVADGALEGRHGQPTRAVRASCRRVAQSIRSRARHRTGPASRRVPPAKLRPSRRRRASAAQRVDTGRPRV